jgi:hypothetical protein
MIEGAVGLAKAKTGDVVNHVFYDEVWAGVHLECARPLSVRERRDAGLQLTGEAYRQCLRGIVQRPLSRRVPERALVSVHRGHPSQDQGLATGL